MSTLKYIQGADESSEAQFATLLPPLERTSAHGPKGTIHKFKSKDNSNMEFYAFGEKLDSGPYIQTSMFIPKYFEGNPSEIRGIFLLKVSSFDKILTLGFFGEKRIGKDGCGYHIQLPEDSLFRFNGFTFHPFILRNLTVCYFATETGSILDDKWKNTNEPGIAVENKIEYSHILDLFTTNHAERKPII